jgi:tetratricopeptide (TPR) repeat protein
MLQRIVNIFVLAICAVAASAASWPTHALTANQSAGAGTVAAGAPDAKTEAQQAYEAGIALIKKGKRDEALRTFKDGLAKDPQNLALLNVVGATYSLSGDFELAQIYLLRATSVDPNFATARKNLAIVYFDSGKLDAAIPEFEKLAQTSPESKPIANLFLGLIAERKAEYARSTAFFEQSGSLLHDYPDALLSYTNALAQLKKTDRVMSMLAVLDSLPDITAEQRYKMGVLYFQMGRDAKALENFDAAAKSKISVPGLDYHRAALLDKLGRSQEAFQILKNASSGTLDADALNLLSHLAKENKEYDLAIQSLRQAAKLAPEREENYLDFSEICMDSGNYPLALEAAEIGLQHIPNSYRLTVQKGAALQRLGRLGESEAILLHASGLRQENSDALLSLAIVETTAGKLQPAADTLTQALRQYPDNYYMHYQLGIVLLNLAEDGKAAPDLNTRAKQEFRNAIRSNPSFADSYYQLAKLYSDSDPKLEEENLLTCLRIDPEHASAEYMLARLYLKTGRTEQGKELMARFEKQQAAAKTKDQKPSIQKAPQ